MDRPLNRREQKKLIRKKSEAANRKLTALFYAMLFLSFSLFIYSYVQYHCTIVDYKIPLLVFIISGLLLSSFVKKYLKDALKLDSIKIHFFWCAFSIGSICMAFSFFLNNILSQSQVRSIKAPIIYTYKTRTRAGKTSVVAKVQLPVFTKDLSFPVKDEDLLKDSDFVILLVSKGGLGFEIIKDRILAE